MPHAKTALVLLMADGRWPLRCPAGALTDGEWGKIAGMGRPIAADNVLFASDTARLDDKLANAWLPNVLLFLG
jgi:hypothetical protein